MRSFFAGPEAAGVEPVVEAVEPEEPELQPARTASAANPQRNVFSFIVTRIIQRFAGASANPLYYECVVVLFAVLALLSPSQVPATQSERLKALQEMTSSAQLKSMDLILPLITDKDPIIRAAAAKAYLAIPKRWQDRVIARAQEVGHQSSEITEAWQEYSRLMEPHEKNLIYGDWLLRVLNDNERGDRKARRALLLDLLAKTPEGLQTR